MLAFLEFIRVVFILLFGTGLLLSLEIWIYRLLDVDLFGNPLGWIIVLANFIIIFVVYRNKLQFKGWFKSSKIDKLSKLTTRILIWLAVILVILPLIID